MTLPDHDHDGGVPTHQIWIAAGVGAVLLAIGVAVALGASGDRERASAGRAAPGASASPTVAAPASTVSASSSPSPSTVSPGSSVSATPAGPVVRWRGTVTVRGPSDYRDLDAVPPAASERDADLTGDWLKPFLNSEADRVRFAAASGSPGPDRCRELLGAGGADRTETLQDGAVVCALTSQGRVARLWVLEASQTTTQPIVRADVTVWDPPTP